RQGLSRPLLRPATLHRNARVEGVAAVRVAICPPSFFLQHRVAAPSPSIGQQSDPTEGVTMEFHPPRPSALRPDCAVSALQTGCDHHHRSYLQTRRAAAPFRPRPPPL